MQPMTAGMNVDPIINIQVLEVKLSMLTIREAMLEAAVQQLTSENTQHKMEIQRLQQIISPPVEDLEAAELAVVKEGEDASADSEPS